MPVYKSKAITEKFIIDSLAGKIYLITKDVADKISSKIYKKASKSTLIDKLLIIEKNQEIMKEKILGFSYSLQPDK